MEEEIREAKAKPAKLSDFAGIVPNQFLYATPPVFQGLQKEQRPAFKIKPPDGLEFNQDLDRDELYSGGKPKLGNFRLHRLKRHLKDWDKFPLGNPIPCPKDAEGNITDAAIACLNPDLQNWLLEVISGVETVTKEESEGLKF
jgi:hypothetical protein